MALNATCSIRYRPSVALEFASPCGNSLVRELKRIRMDSTMDAPSTTVFPYASYSTLLVVVRRQILIGDWPIFTESGVQTLGLGIEWAKAPRFSTPHESTATYGAQS